MKGARRGAPGEHVSAPWRRVRHAQTTNQRKLEIKNEYFLGRAEEDRQAERGGNYTRSYLQYDHDASSIAALPPTRGRLVVVIGPRPSDRRDD